MTQIEKTAFLLFEENKARRLTIQRADKQFHDYVHKWSLEKNYKTSKSL